MEVPSAVRQDLFRLRIDWIGNTALFNRTGGYTWWLLTMTDTLHASVSWNDVRRPLKSLPLAHVIATSLGIAALLEARLIGTGRQADIAGDTLLSIIHASCIPQS